MSAASENHSPSAVNLFIIRVAFMATVLTFGAVVYFLHSTGRQRPVALPQELTWAVIGAWAVVAAALMYLSRRYRDAPTRARKASLAIVGWGLGEAAAMIGGAHYLLSGQPIRYGYGLLIFVIALVLLPIPRDEPRLRRLK